MKKLIYVLSIALLLTACKDEPKDYATLSGKIINKNSDSLIVNLNGYRKRINVNSDGSFSDTLKKIETGGYRLFDGRNITIIYLENGYDLKLSIDTKNPNRTITYSGTGAEVNNYLSEKALINREIIMNSSLFDIEKEAFDKKIIEIDNSYNALLEKIKNVDSSFVNDQKREIALQKNNLLRKYEDKHYINTFLAKGKASPKFVDYENFNGKKTSLNDLKGKYVYITLWVTRRYISLKSEIPYLKSLEKEYQDKKIAFVSISIDSEKDYNIWKQLIIGENLGGIQLFAKEDRSFRDAYKVNGTPRFILIDPKGDIVSADAPRPSSNGLKELFDSLKL